MKKYKRNYENLPQVCKQIWLKKNKVFCNVVYMTEDTLEEALLLRQNIRAQMEHQEWFASSEQEDFEKALEDGFALLAVVKGKIIGALQCILNHTDYSKDRYDNEVEQTTCADYSDVYVHPDFQGNGIQNSLEKIMEEICLSQGKYTLLGTVDSNNEYSYNNFLGAGYYEVGRLVKYGGLERVLMEKKIHKI